MHNVTEREFGGLRVVLTGGTDGRGGGNGPLVVLLHGYGAPGRDLVPLSQVLSVPEGTRFAFPAAPLSLGPDLGPAFMAMFDSRAWWPIDIERFERALSGLGGRPDLQSPAVAALMNDVPAGLASARGKLLAALDAMERDLAVPPHRMLLGGFSQGAMLSLDTALRSQRPLAGLLLLSGTLLCKPEWLPLMPARAGLPVFQSHGKRDPLLPFFIAEALRDHLQKAKLAVEFCAFPGQHEIPHAILRAASAFITATLTAPVPGSGVGTPGPTDHV
jgi:phospholipase/carboxylesterase